jgi:hypothetical protein
VTLTKYTKSSAAACGTAVVAVAVPIAAAINTSAVDRFRSG